MASQVDVLVADFVAKLRAAIEAEMARQIETALSASFGSTGRRWRAGVRAAHPVSAARRLQGQYLGRLRALKGRDRVRIKAIAKARGVAAAVHAANKLRRR